MYASNITYNVLMNLFIWLILGKKMIVTENLETAYSIFTKNCIKY